MYLGRRVALTRCCLAVMPPSLDFGFGAALCPSKTWLVTARHSTYAHRLPACLWTVHAYERLAHQLTVNPPTHAYQDVGQLLLKAQGDLERVRQQLDTLPLQANVVRARAMPAFSTLAIPHGHSAHTHKRFGAAPQCVV